MSQLPDLIQSMQGRDFGHLMIVAELWGIDLDAPDARTALQRLARRIMDGELLPEVVEALPEAGRQALAELVRQEGRIPWAAFTRRYGIVREMGAAKRDRERPFEGPGASIAETLWYRALIGRTFFDTPNGPEEFAFIPAELLESMPPAESQAYTPLGRPATPAERLQPLPADSSLLDDACTLLAALRLGLPLDMPAAAFVCGIGTPYPLPPQPLKSLLEGAGLLDSRGVPLAEPTRSFLEASRGDALLTLWRAYLRSERLNELRLLPGLSAEGEWHNDPLRARHALLDFLSTVPGSLGESADPARRPFWSLGSFIASVRQAYPDFQRSAGEYDAWFIRDLASGETLRGFEHWDAVEGALLRYLIGGPLHWLGVLDLAVSQAQGGPAALTAFRFSAWAVDLLNHKPPFVRLQEDGALLVNKDGSVQASVRLPRAARYQLARFCEWEGRSPDATHYRLTPASLQRARQNGLQMQHLLALLRRHARTIPPSLLQALERWETQGSAARLERLFVLRFKDPEILQALRASRAARYLGDALGPDAVMVKPGAAHKVMAILAEMGYLGDLVNID